LENEKENQTKQAYQELKLRLIFRSRIRRERRIEKKKPLISEFIKTFRNFIG